LDNAICWAVILQGLGNEAAALGGMMQGAAVSILNKKFDALNRF